MSLPEPRFKTPRQFPPVYWMKEESGVLKTCVHTALDYFGGVGPEPTKEQLSILVDYFNAWLDCGRWSEDTPVKQLTELLDGVENAEHLRSWIRAALRAGIDPL